ncbi:B12D protein [Artemisia annua]|uniref:B12D protein n=1 Tax=Artemisia annua TaxID=35608 RepID=A0A2U1M983_ARTAN|nr:B12D protein [Artemisia annua]
MPRWVRPEVYPLMAAMTFVTSMCVFQLTRNIFMNPDVRYIAKLNQLSFRFMLNCSTGLTNQSKPGLLAKRKLFETKPRFN